MWVVEKTSCKATCVLLPSSWRKHGKDWAIPNWATAMGRSPITPQSFQHSCFIFPSTSMVLHPWTDPLDVLPSTDQTQWMIFTKSKQHFRSPPSWTCEPAPSIPQRKPWPRRDGHQEDADWFPYGCNRGSLWGEGFTKMLGSISSPPPLAGCARAVPSDLRQRSETPAK